MIQSAMAHGPGGPATAIYSVQAVYLTIFEAGVMGRTLSVVEIISLVLCLVGCLFVLLPERFVQKLSLYLSINLCLDLSINDVHLEEWSSGDVAHRRE